MNQWMTREQISDALGIVPNSVRGKVQKGQIERKVVDGKNLYRIVDAKTKTKASGPAPAPEPSPVKTPTPKYEPEPIEDVEEVLVLPEIVIPERVHPSPEREEPEVVIPTMDARSDFDPSLVLLNQLASLRIGRGIDAIEKGDEIDLATGEISRDLEARITMRQQKQMKEIQDALERLKAKEYGICEECGDPIPEQRLRLYPAARFCVRCQEEADYYEKLREETAMRGGVWREEPSDSGFGKSFEE